MTELAGNEVPFYFTQHARFVDQLSLVATDSAVSVARTFAKLTLGKWRARTIAADAALVVSELVTNAVKATGGVLEQSPPWSELAALELVFVRILGLDASIVIEVWDTSDATPVLLQPDDDAEGGRGLLLVDEAAARWGYCRTPRGKVVWAEIAVPEALPTVLPRRRTSAGVRPLVRADPWLLQRLLTGLRTL
ncbi:ATP-binding protein [Yinghuangia sp. ASG 101]|uniref:ATP-binding protein n=1 Tax=Yinghuangia sp. ASG 101 TaxID=2896848 RepID=UPI001E48584D|nr:ATP-binding protein [Yinghuangia sp. ASG 101]UGQ14779.1 ATP-binding protein [Yinghuangia sp. ASG 101]